MAGKTKAKKTTAKKSSKPSVAKGPDVIVYTADWCPWCHRAMDFLKENKVGFQARDVDTPAFAKEAVDKSGQSGIPVIVVGKDIVVGFDEGRLKSLLKIK